jgi:hypothetical protein
MVPPVCIQIETPCRGDRVVRLFGTVTVKQVTENNRLWSLALTRLFLAEMGNKKDREKHVVTLEERSGRRTGEVGSRH